MKAEDTKLQDKWISAYNNEYLPRNNICGIQHENIYNTLGHQMFVVILISFVNLNTSQTWMVGLMKLSIFNVLLSDRCHSFLKEKLFKGEIVLFYQKIRSSFRHNCRGKIFKNSLSRTVKKLDEIGIDHDLLCWIISQRSFTVCQSNE